jgi:hypothetical protein
MSETERTTAFGSITSGYVAIGTPFAYPSIKYVLQNETDAPISFSIDGANSEITLYPGKSFTSDVGTNKMMGGGMIKAKGTQYYIKYVSAPTSGAVYISTYYGANFDNL